MSPRLVFFGGFAVLAILLALVVAGPVFDEARPRTGSKDPALTRPDGPSLLTEKPLRAAVGRLRERYGTGRLVALRLDRRRLTATVAVADGRLAAVTLRSNGLDRATSSVGGGTGPSVRELTVDALPKLLRRVARLSGREVSGTAFVTLDQAAGGRFTLTDAAGERWTSSFDGSRVQRFRIAAPDVDALRRCFERARTPEAQAACAS